MTIRLLFIMCLLSFSWLPSAAHAVTDLGTGGTIANLGTGGTVTDVTGYLFRDEFSTDLAALTCSGVNFMTLTPSIPRSSRVPTPFSFRIRTASGRAGDISSANALNVAIVIWLLRRARGLGALRPVFA